MAANNLRGFFWEVFETELFLQKKDAVLE